jgi:threonine/homoserine/homoserine lactone efflux protein
VWNAVGQILPAAVGVALSPIPIIAVVLMLVTPRGPVNGPMFLVGWLVGLAIVGVIVLAIAGPTASNSDGSPTTGANWLEIVLGGLLLVVALRQFRGRPHGDDEPVTPKWMSTIDTFTPLKAAGAGAVLAAVNPKNLLLSISAAATIAQTAIPGGQQAAAYLVFALIASIGVAAPIVISFAMGERARAILDELKEWMEHNNAVIMSVLCLVIGAKLIGQGMAGF